MMIKTHSYKTRQDVQNKGYGTTLPSNLFHSRSLTPKMAIETWEQEAAAQGGLGEDRNLKKIKGKTTLALSEQICTRGGNPHQTDWQFRLKNSNL